MKKNPILDDSFLGLNVSEKKLRGFWNEAEAKKHSPVVQVAVPYNLVVLPGQTTVDLIASVLSAQ
jgi:hypothetical protein